MENTSLALPEHWRPFVRPNGSLYYYFPAQRLVTSQDMHNPHLRELVEENIHKLTTLAALNGLQVSHDWELSVEVHVENGEEVVRHNYISHEDGQYFQLGESGELRH